MQTVRKENDKMILTHYREAKNDKGEAVQVRDIETQVDYESLTAVRQTLVDEILRLNIELQEIDACIIKAKEWGFNEVDKNDRN